MEDNTTNQTTHSNQIEERIHHLNQIDKDLIHLLNGINNQSINNLSSIIKDIKAEINKERTHK